MSLSRQSTALVLTTKNKETKHYGRQKRKRQTEKPALANKTNKAFIDIRLRPVSQRIAIRPTTAKLDVIYKTGST